MIDWVASLPWWLGSMLSAFLAITLGMSIYIASHYSFGRNCDARTEDLAINLFRILATLLSLLLSLTFADLREGISEVRQSVEAEASALGNTLRDLEAFDDAAAARAQTQLITYLRSAVEEEWDQLRDGQISTRTMVLFGNAKQAIYDLEPKTSRQEKIHNRLIADISSVNSTRASRLVYRGGSGRLLFLYVALAGFASTAALLCTYPPRSKSLTFIAVYFGFFGVLTHIVFELGQFYEGLAAVTPEPLEFLLTLAKERY
jgi:hypothetical protein